MVLKNTVGSRYLELQGLSEIHRDTRTSTYQISRIEKTCNNQMSRIHMSFDFFT